MTTLTHEPLALAGVLILGLAVATSLIVGAALWIRSMVLRRATNRIDEAIDAAAALTEPDPTPRETQFAQDVACYLASERMASGVRYWPAPPIVPGKDVA